VRKLTFPHSALSPKANCWAVLPTPDAGRPVGDPSVVKLLAYLGTYE
jgi:hypothetical protein